MCGPSDFERRCCYVRMLEKEAGVSAGGWGSERRRGQGQEALTSAWLLHFAIGRQRRTKLLLSLEDNVGSDLLGDIAVEVRLHICE